MMETAALAFATVFVAELGDKSQLMAASLSSRYRLRTMMAAVGASSALTMAVSVTAGALLGRTLPAGLLSAVAGVLFLVFALRTLREKSEEEDGADAVAVRRGFWAVVAAMAVAEFGDKTMVAAFALAATTSTFGVWVGATLGMAGAGMVGVLVGAAIWRRLKPATVRLVSAGMFAIIGVALLVAPLVGW